MCGIAGLWDIEGRWTFEQRQALCAQMTQRLRHRGPDAAGQWDENGLSLGHRRLSILDLSEAGAQPMQSRDGRWVIAFNGEIYNHQDLRAEIAAAGFTSFWRGRSDTEALIEAIAFWGIETTLARLNGMFAFAAFDRQAQTLYFARDRMGEKPLYYGSKGGLWFWASESKAFHVIPEALNAVCPKAMASYLQKQYIPHPASIWEGVCQLPPATFLKIRAQEKTVPSPQRYWTLPQTQNATASTLEEAAEELHARLLHAVRLRMDSDVPMGCFLSGGVDSSTMAALMQAQTKTPIHSFCIGFDDPKKNEAPYAEAVARHVGAQHETDFAREEDLLSVIPHLPMLYDEPFADMSALPTALLCRRARQTLTVALSGDGGDELFAGYGRYHIAAKEWQALQSTPLWERRLKSVAAANWASLSGKTNKRWAAAGAPSFPVYLDTRFALWPSHVQQAHDFSFAAPSDPLVQATAKDLDHYLPDDILTKIDRASMAVGLETRAPLLDHTLVEWVARLPSAIRFAPGYKTLLKKVLFRYVPEALIERPKQGFEPPLAEWLRGPLRSWAEDLLASTRHDIDLVPARRLWRRHLSGRNAHQPLWAVLVLLQWLESVKR